MTTADLRWTPAATAPSTLDDLVAEDEPYIGKHRNPRARTLSVLRMMYRPRHRAR